MSVHEGHRQRKKEQFREHGLDAFADHEALELLLYYAIPRQDTNPIAHRLIERFGSLEGVFSAPAYELQKVEGVGENAATLIRLLFPLCRRVRTSGGRHEVIFNTRENIGSYFIELFLGERREVFYEVCLDAKGKLLACYRLAEGSPDQVTKTRSTPTRAWWCCRTTIRAAWRCRARRTTKRPYRSSGRLRTSACSWWTM